MTARVCVVGSVNADLTFSVRALPRPGETIIASGLLSACGGKGGNQAVAAARAGATVELVAALGTDAAARQLRAHLVDNGVGVDGLVAVDGPSGTAAILVDGNAENCIVVAPGANAHLSLASTSLQRPVADCEVVLISLEIPVDTALAAARIARAAGAVVMLNASPTPDRPSALAPLVDVVVVNEDEAGPWLGLDDPPPHLVVTRGSAGARHRVPRDAHPGAAGAAQRPADTDFDMPAPTVEAVDTTGAGDVFAGVLAATWPRGARIAVRRACVAGALATLTPGAGDCAPWAAAIDSADADGADETGGSDR